jgi:hypothetical protein
MSDPQQATVTRRVATVERRSIDPWTMWSKPIVAAQPDSYHDLGPDSNVFEPEGMGSRMGWASFAVDEYQWKEADFLDTDVRLWMASTASWAAMVEPFGQTIKYQVPGPPHNVGYTHHIGIPTGTILGKRIVSGFAGLDRSYGGLSNTWYRTKVHNNLEEVWLVWGGIDASGQKQSGVLVAGPGEFVVGFYQHPERGILVTSDTCEDLEIEWVDKAGKGVPAAVRFSMGGLDFQSEFDGSNAIYGQDMTWTGCSGGCRSSTARTSLTCSASASTSRTFRSSADMLPIPRDTRGKLAPRRWGPESASGASIVPIGG